jgi:hypothetical protein
MVGTAFFGDLNPRWRALRDLQRTEFVAGGLLVLAILWMGVYPKPFTDRISDGVEALPAVETRVTGESALTPRPPSRHARDLRLPLLGEGEHAPGDRAALLPVDHSSAGSLLLPIPHLTREHTP